MAWNISAGAIKNPIPPILLILALLFAGLTAFFRLLLALPHFVPERRVRPIGAICTAPRWPPVLQMVYS